MGSSLENRDLHSYYTTKITRWKGNYPRIFSIGTHGIATYNPADSELTNYWQWTDVININPLTTADHPLQFQLVFRKGRSSDSMKFECEHRHLILEKSLEQYKLFAKSHQLENLEKCVTEFPTPLKYRHGTAPPARLEKLLVTPNCIIIIRPDREKKTYNYSDLECLINSQDEKNVFALQMKSTSRLHIYSHPSSLKILDAVTENSLNFIGLAITTKTLNCGIATLLEKRLGVHGNDSDLTSLSEYTVLNAKRVRKLLCLTETCLVEREPSTYSVTSLSPLSTIHSLIRSLDDSQQLQIETVNQLRTFYSTERDSLLASLIDGARASGNYSVNIKSRPTPLGRRWGPLCSAVDERVESTFLKFIHQPPPSWTWSELLLRFNANIAYSGLEHAVSSEKFFAENKEKLILVALNDLITRDVAPDDYEEYFQLIRRIVCSKTGFGAFSEMQTFREKLGSTIVTALRSPTTPTLVIYSALDIISALMQPMHAEADLKQEQDNKEKILNSPKFMDSLLEFWEESIKRGTGALVTMAMLDILTFGLCSPYSETTLGHHFDYLLTAVAGRSKILYQLFQHQSITIVKGAGLVMKALIEEGDLDQIGRRMQLEAMREGAVLRHLINALFIQKTSDGRLLTLRQLSRHLVSLWLSENSEGMDLLGRVLPGGLLKYLESEERVQVDVDMIEIRDNLKIASAVKEMTQLEKNLREVERFVERRVEVTLRHWRLSSAQKLRSNHPRPVTLRKRRRNIKTNLNWLLLFHKFSQDITQPDLIWNHSTREELRELLQQEVRLLDSDRDSHDLICWNYQDFQVEYKSTVQELSIGGYYLRLLLESREDVLIRDPGLFFNQLYHRFLLTGRSEMRNSCLQAMSLVYSKHYIKIGQFTDTKYLLLMLEKSNCKLERDYIVLFLKALSSNSSNHRDIVSGVKVLIDLLTLAHLDNNRPVIPNLIQSNLIEAGAEQRQVDSREWYYIDGEGAKAGPVGFNDVKMLYKDGKISPKTKLWAAGLDSWRQLQSVSQLKWFLVYEEQKSHLTETKLAIAILDILNKLVSSCPGRDSSGAVIRPVHYTKQLLGEYNTIVHIANLCLTFEPGVVERVGEVVRGITSCSPSLPNLYRTGIFFFLLMYNGSNIQSLTTLLYETHMKQAVAAESSSKSVLSPLLPEAMIQYLINSGPSEFGRVYLGEYDTPETIWSSSMRLRLIQSIALHLYEYTPRLVSNTRSIYEYMAIPYISYTELEGELYCSGYYLRNLIDESRFKEWPIREPLQLLKSVLDSWQEEVDRKPCEQMSLTTALKTLELDSYEIESIKKAYRRLAHKYHPDKNTEGRTQFELVNRAYEYLCSRIIRDKPDPGRIVLLIRTQSLLFKTYKHLLSPYKYPGYSLLIKTIKLELNDEQLFSRDLNLLESSLELVYYTVDCCSLNVEELRRENGLLLILNVLERCLPLLSSTKTNRIVTNILLTIKVSTNYNYCIDTLVEENISTNIVSLFSSSDTQLLLVLVDLLQYLCRDNLLQMQLVQSGLLWKLIQLLFNYDYTLDEQEGDVNNKQLLLNEYCVGAVHVLKALLGCHGDIKSPRNELVELCLSSLLLPYGLKQLRTADPRSVLKLLNENTKSAHFIWSRSTRSELLDYCDKELLSIKNGESCNYGVDFKYSDHNSELFVGGVFIRIYNQVDALIEGGEQLLRELFKYLETGSSSVEDTKQVLLAACKLVKKQGLTMYSKLSLISNYLNNPNYELESINLTISLLDGSMNSELIGSNIIVITLLILGNSASPNLEPCLQLISTMVTNSNTNLLKELISKSCLLYLINIMSNQKVESTIRVKAVEIISKLISDKLIGPRARIVVSKFLPPTLVETLIESPTAAINLYDSDIKSPELIWSQDSRNLLSLSLSELLNTIYIKSKTDYSYSCTIPDDYIVDYSGGELVVSGVYLRLYLENSGWVLRRPREFLRDLLELLLVGSEVSDLVGKALILLLQQQPNLLDLLVPMGVLPGIVNSLGNSCIGSLMTLVTMNANCRESLKTQSTVTSIKKTIATQFDVSLLSCLANIYSSQDSLSFVREGLDCKLVDYLLDLLAGKIVVNDNKTVRALAVKVLQGMSCHGDDEDSKRVKNILDGSSTWREYAGQNHDLFLKDAPSHLYLPPPTSSVSGYLTQGKSVVKSPPPI